MINPKLRKTIYVFHTIAIFNFLFGAVIYYFAYLKVHAVLFIGFGIFIEYVIKELKEYKYWAWIAGIIISALYIFALLGIFSLIGLLQEETRNNFIKTIKK